MTTQIAYNWVQKNSHSYKNLGEKMSTDGPSQNDFFAPSYTSCTSRENIPIFKRASDRFNF